MSDSNKAIVIRVAKTAEEFAQVAHIRRRAYIDIGHIQPDEDRDMLDSLDQVSNTFVACVAEHDSPVGTFRITLAPTPFEGAKFIDPWVKPGERAAELSRMAVLPEFQRRKFQEQSVFQALAMAGYRYLAAANAVSYIITIDRNAKVYEAYGFERLQGPFTYPGYARDHYLLRRSSLDGLRGNAS